MFRQMIFSKRKPLLVINSSWERCGKRLKLSGVFVSKKWSLKGHFQFLRIWQRCFWMWVDMMKGALEQFWERCLTMSGKSLNFKNMQYAWSYKSNIWEKKKYKRANLAYGWMVSTSSLQDVSYWNVTYCKTPKSYCSEDFLRAVEDYSQPFSY